MSSTLLCCSGVGTAYLCIQPRLHSSWDDAVRALHRHLSASTAIIAAQLCCACCDHLVTSKPACLPAGAEGPDQLQQAIQGHMQAVKGARVKKALGQVHKGLEKRMAGPVVGLLDTFPGALWSKLHTLSRETVSICTKELLMVGCCCTYGLLCGLVCRY